MQYQSYGARIVNAGAPVMMNIPITKNAQGQERWNLKTDSAGFRGRKMRPIDADVLKVLMMADSMQMMLFGKKYELSDAMKTVNNAPTIDAMPVKHGKWITEEKDCIYGKKIRLKCSECGDTFDVSETAYPYERFCRYCGAKMDGERKEE